MSPDPECLQVQRDSYAHDGGSDDDLSDDEGEHSDDSYDALEERFHGLEEEVAILVADVHDLALYTKLNITGFMKILKASCSVLKFPSTIDSSYSFLQKHDVKPSSLASLSESEFIYLIRNKPMSHSKHLSYKNILKSNRFTNITGTPL